jgi:hypothetical protein
MPTENSPDEIDIRIDGHEIKFPTGEIDELLNQTRRVKENYAKIRGIDTTGFEPAAIFVPTPSKQESN